MSSINGLGSVDAIAQQLMQVFDRNKDGQLTTAEFSAVLSGLLGGGTAGTSAASTAAAIPAASAGPKRTDHLAGFVPSKLESSQSIKYKFGRAAADFDLSSVKDKASAEALLNNMKPAFEREGLKVLEISKDRIKVDYEGKPLWIDVIQGATSGSPLFQWLPDGV